MARPPYNPYAERCEVHFECITDDNHAVYLAPSFTDQTDSKPRYSMAINLVSGTCGCDCPDFS